MSSRAAWESFEGIATTEKTQHHAPKVDIEAQDTEIQERCLALATTTIYIPKMAGERCNEQYRPSRACGAASGRFYPKRNKLMNTTILYDTMDRPEHKKHEPSNAHWTQTLSKVYSVSLRSSANVYLRFLM
jgi:hypothetical protein